MAEFDKYAAHYEALFSESVPRLLAEKEYFIEYKIRHVQQKLSNKAPKAILDFGCGIGLSVTHFQRYFPDALIYGYDISETSVEIAKARTGLSTISANTHSLPAGTFDVIFVANVFHHIAITQQGSIIALCKQLLAPGGSLFIFEHNPFNPLTRYVFFHCDLDREAIMLRKKEVIALAKSHGLRVVHSAYTLFFPKFASALRPLEKYLHWLPMGAQYCVEMTSKNSNL